jgi:probable phosphoglycerate mutase
MELKRLFKPTKIYSSDLRRAYRTACVIADNLNLEVNIDTRIREMSFGDYEGKGYKDIDKTLFKNWLTNPFKYKLKNQESKESLFSRLNSFWNEIISSEDKEIVVVAHGGTVQGLICIALNIPLENIWAFKHTNASFSVIQYQNGKSEIKVLNYTNHLDNFRNNLLETF